MRGILCSNGQSEAFGGKGTGWENAGAEGALQVERKTYCGRFHRSFRQLPGGQREWMYVIKEADGSWKPISEPSAGVGEVEERDGTFYGIEFRKNKTGHLEPVSVQLPRLEA